MRSLGLRDRYLIVINRLYLSGKSRGKLYGNLLRTRSRFIKPLIGKQGSRNEQNLNSANSRLSKSLPVKL